MVITKCNMSLRIFCVFNCYGKPILLFLTKSCYSIFIITYVIISCCFFVFVFLLLYVCCFIISVHYYFILFLFYLKQFDTSTYSYIYQMSCDRTRCTARFAYFTHLQVNNIFAVFFISNSAPDIIRRSHKLTIFSL